VIIDVPDAAVPYVWAVLQDHAARLRRNGREPPEAVAEFADVLVRTADRNVTRSRELAAARNRRYRARLRAQRQSLSA
jgi:hypothetical protein